MAKGKRVKPGRYAGRAYFEGMELRLSGKTSMVQVNRSPKEHEKLVAHLRELREQAPEEIRARDAAIMAELAPYKSTAIFGHVYFQETTANPETYQEWAHSGLALRVEHLAMLLLKRGQDGDRTDIPFDLVVRLNEHLQWLTSNLLILHGQEVSPSASPHEPDPRSAVLMWELFVRMPSFMRQYRETLPMLFAPVWDWMMNALGFEIGDIIAVELAFERNMNAMLLREMEPVRAARSALRKHATIFDGKLMARVGHEEAAVEANEAFQREWFSAMARIGAGIALTVTSISATSGVDAPRVERILKFFETTRADVTEYDIPVPDCVLKTKPFIQMVGRWALPSATLLLPAVQPALERAMNPAVGRSTADAGAWKAYVANRAAMTEARSAAALSKLLGVPTYQQAKYKSAIGQKSYDEIDVIGLVDRRLFLLECKAGTFTATARRGDIDAIEERIKSLMTDAHAQALRALRYVYASSPAIFKSEEGTLSVQRADLDEIYLITVTLEELGYMAAHYSDVRRTPIGDKKEMPWVVSLHDLETVAKYMPRTPYFVDYLEKRIALNSQSALGANDELDWMGRYFYDALSFAENKDLMTGAFADHPLTTGTLMSHTTEIEAFELFQDGTRVTSAPKPGPAIQKNIDGLIAAVDAWRGDGFLQAACGILHLPAKLQRSFGKRVRAMKVGRGQRYVQEVARADDGAQLVCVTVCKDDRELASVPNPRGFGECERNVHILLNRALAVLQVRIANSARC